MGRRLAVGVVLAVLAVACASRVAVESEPPVTDRPPSTPGSMPRPDDRAEEPADRPGDDAADEDGEMDEGEVVDLEALGVNELGQIPVIMYHRIVEDGSSYDTSPDDFRAELQALWEGGYRPITVADLVDGNIDVPAGTSPVVLTFDDASASQFALDDHGNVATDTAVGILQQFAAEHPDFTPTASFYVLAHNFGASGDRAHVLLRALDELGFELGNHTADHENLGQLDGAGVQAALAAGVRNLRAAVPDAPVRTLSLPYGAYPQDRALAHRGSSDGIDYRHDGVLLVGSSPSPSPFHRTFDALAIPRIRSNPEFDPDGEPDFGSGYWLWQLEQQPGLRYVSDGDPDTVAFPAERADDLAPSFASRARPY